MKYEYFQNWNKQIKSIIFLYILTNSENPSRARKYIPFFWDGFSIVYLNMYISEAALCFDTEKSKIIDYGRFIIYGQGVGDFYFRGRQK